MAWLGLGEQGRQSKRLPGDLGEDWRPWWRWVTKSFGWVLDFYPGD